MWAQWVLVLVGVAVGVHSAAVHTTCSLHDLDLLPGASTEWRTMLRVYEAETVRVGSNVSVRCGAGRATKEGLRSWNLTCMDNGLWSNPQACLVGDVPANMNRIAYGVQALFASVDGTPGCNSPDCGPPAFAQGQVFDMTSFGQNRTFDGLMRIPDGWWYQPDAACDLTSSSDDIFSWADYDSTVNAYTKDESRGLFHHSTRSEWFNAIVRVTAHGQSSLVRQSFTCSSYVVARDVFANTTVLTNSFRNAVAALPTTAGTPAAQQALFAFTQQFGTAVVDWARFGGKAVCMSEFSASSFSELKRQQGDLTSSATLNLLCQLHDHVLCNPGNPNWDRYKAFNSSASQHHLSYVPVLVPDPSMGHGANQWAEAAERDPDVIDFRLRSVAALLTPTLFPNDSSITLRQQALEQFLQSPEFCTLTPGGCGALPSLMSRWVKVPRLALPQPLHGATAASVPTPDAPTGSTRIFAFGGSSQASPSPADASLGPALSTASNEDEGVDADSSARPSTLTLTAPKEVFKAPLLFDTANGSWAYLAQPTRVDPGASPLIFSASAVLDGMPVVTGGIMSPSGKASPVVVRLNPQTGSWGNVASLSQRRGYHCAVVAAGKLHVIGGYDGASRLASVEAYDADTNTWSVRNSMPVVRSGHGCSVVNSTLVYVTGGYQKNGVLETIVHVYNAAVDTWETNPAKLPPPMTATEVPRFAHAQVTVEGAHNGGSFGPFVVLLGGMASATTVINDVRVLDLSTNLWSAGCPLVSPAAYAAALLVTHQFQFFPNATEIHVIGGYSAPNTPQNAHQIFVIPDNATLTCAASDIESGRGQSVELSAESRRDDSVFLTREQVKQAHARSAGAAVRLGLPTHLPTASSAVQPLSSVIGAGLSTISGQLTGASVFLPLCETCFANQSEFNGFALPDGVAFDSIGSCSYHTLVATTHDRVEVHLAASAFFELAAHVGIPLLFSYSFSGSASASVAARAVYDYRAVVSQATAQCSGWQLGYGHLPYAAQQDDSQPPIDLSAAKLPQLAPDFEQAILNVPLDTPTLRPYMDILQHFGDVVVVGFEAGARVTQQFLFQEHAFDAVLNAHVDLQYSTSHSFLFFWKKSHSEGATADVHADAHFREYVYHNQTHCQPGCPVPVDNATINSTAWHALAAGVGSPNGRSAPIKFVIFPITALINIFTFRNPFIGARLKAVRETLHNMVANGTYCALTPGCYEASHAPRWTQVLRCPPTGCPAAAGGAIAFGQGAASRPTLYFVSSSSHWFATLNTSMLDAVAPQWEYHAAAPAAHGPADVALTVVALTPDSTSESAVVRGASSGGPDRSSQHNAYDVLVMMGGTSTRNAVSAFNTTRRSWHALQPVPDLAANVGANAPLAVINGSLFVFLSASGQCRAARLASPTPSANWSVGPAHTVADGCLLGAAAFVSGGSVLIMGGIRPGGTCSDVVVSFNPATGLFETLFNLPAPACSPMAVALDDRLAVVFLDNGELYKFDGQQLVFTPLPLPPGFSIAKGAIAYSQAGDSLMLLTDNALFGMQHVLHTQFTPVVGQSGLSSSDDKARASQTPENNRDDTSKERGEHDTAARVDEIHNVDQSEPKAHAQVVRKPADHALPHPKKTEQALLKDARGPDGETGHSRLSGHRDTEHVHAAVDQGQHGLGDKPLMRFPSMAPFLHGYHSIVGDPFSSGEADPGWRKQAVFDFPPGDDASWQQRMSVPGDNYDWALPDGLAGQGFSQSSFCQYFEYAVKVSGRWGLRHVLAKYFPLADLHFGFPSIFGAEFSASATAKYVEHAWAAMEAEVLFAIGRCLRYKIAVVPSGAGVASPFNFTDQFVHDLRALPTNNASDALSDFRRLAFVTRYGTQVPTSIDFGALVVRVSAMASGNVNALFGAEFDFSLGAEANLLFLLGLKASAGAHISASVDAEFRANLVDNYTVCVPQCPPGSPIADESAAPWVQQLVNGNGSVQVVGATFAPLPQVVYDSQGQLPSDLQGSALEARLQGMVDFVEHRLCPLVPGCATSHVQAQWVEAASSPSNGPTALPAALAFATTLYQPSAKQVHVIGGETQTIGGRSAAVQTFDVEQQQWVRGYDLGTARSRAAGVVLANSSLLMCGGLERLNQQGQRFSLATCEMSAGAGHVWIFAPSMNLPRFGHSMALYQGDVFVLGGFVGKHATAAIEFLNCSAGSTAAGTWVTLAQSLRVPLYGMASWPVPALGGVLLVGGADGSVASANVELFKPFDNSTTNLTSTLSMKLPEPRFFSRMVPLLQPAGDDSSGSSIRFLLVAGLSSTTACTFSTFILDLNASTIAYGPTSPWCFLGTDAALLPDALSQVTTGSNNTSTTGNNVLLAGGYRAVPGKATAVTDRVSYLSLA